MKSRGKGCVVCEVLTEHCIDFGLALGKVCSHQRAWSREATCSDLRQRNCSCYCVENTQQRQEGKLKESRQDTINQLWDHGVRIWGSKYEHYCWLKRRWKHWRQQWFPWYWIPSSHKEHRSTIGLVDQRSKLSLQPRQGKPKHTALLWRTDHKQKAEKGWARFLVPGTIYSFFIWREGWGVEKRERCCNSDPLCLESRERKNIPLPNLPCFWFS